MFTGGFRAELVEKVLANKSDFSLEEITSESSSGVCRGTKLSAKLLFPCLASVQNARLSLGDDNTR